MDTNDRRRSRGAGIDLHLVKPVDIGALEKLLADLPVSRSPFDVPPVRTRATTGDILDAIRELRERN